MARKSSGKASSERDYVLKITLCETEPPVWRRVRVPGEITLDWLHLVIQAAMGWDDDHHYEFHLGKASYGAGEDVRPAGNAVLQKLITRAKTKLRYTYDFGDCWEHEIVTEKIETAGEGTREPEVLDGARACPPEDCGGPYTYHDLLEQVADPDDPEHEDALDILGDDFDPEAFSLKDARKRLKAFLRAGPADSDDEDFGDEGDEFVDVDADEVNDPLEEDSANIMDLLNSVSGEQAGEFVELMDQGAWMLTANTLEDLRVKEEGDEEFIVPAVGFCVTMKSGIPNIVEHHVADFAQRKEPMVVTLMKKAAGRIEALPKAVFVMNEQAKTDLERTGFGDRVRIVVNPVVDHMGRILARDFLEHAGEEAPPLEVFAPDFEQDDVSRELAVRYFAAAHDFYAAKPWKGLPPDCAFCLTFPGGEEMHVIVMGQGRMETGALVFASPEDCAAFWRISQSFPPDPGAMPVLLSISFDDVDACGDELADLACDCFGAWSRTDRLPVTIKTTAGGGFEQPTAVDFEALALATAALAAFRKHMRKAKKAWPPREEACEEIDVSLQGLEPCRVKVRGYRLSG